MKTVAIAGTGRLARALALALRRSRDLGFAGAWGRRPGAVDELLAVAGSGRRLVPGELFAADVVFLAVADDAIAPLAAELRCAAPQGAPTGLWLHGSGALGLEPFAALCGLGLRFATLHPLASLDAREADPLAGCPLILGGDPAVRAAAVELAGALGGRPLWIEGLDRPLYHAAAALLANGLTSLYSLGLDLLRRASGGAIGRAETSWLAASALRPLLADEPAAALTGPVSRGDEEVVRRHRQALQAHDPRALVAYDALMKVALELAERAGLPPERAAAVAAALGERP